MQELLDDNWGEKDIPIKEYASANIAIRLVAFFIDSFVFLLVLGFIFNAFSQDFQGVIIMIVLLFILYQTAVKQRVGLGKRLLQLQVVHVKEEKVHWMRIVLRTLLRYMFIGNPIIFGIVTFIAQARRKDPQQIFFHDVITNTKVVKATTASKKEDNLGVIREY